ncbi:MAG: hypothetical protein ACXVRZ_10575, partial [Gaiellaceae bacterium]
GAAGRDHNLAGRRRRGQTWRLSTHMGRAIGCTLTPMSMGSSSFEVPTACPSIVAVVLASLKVPLERSMKTKLP